ncbi:MMPL family transporter [Hydrogenophaga sp. BPS33]|uniref:MMPL family transporter n=1 Tax=Hydrogenophaga sp. BPS33 TaxID=2651974 RepID=UPI00132018EE|nr:MMPL family transporter [Hydrogenophaga sp. BPS33]QHE88392.1 MMPL family transporter [Hydrogenophaga sp. BPS33]
MNRGFWRALLIWLAAMGCGVVLLLDTRFSADVSFFLPSKPTPEQQVMVDQLREGAVSRLLMLAIAGGTPEQRADASRALRAALAKDPSLETVQNGEAEALETVRDFMLDHRYQLSNAVTPERFSVEGLRDAVLQSVDMLSSSAGLLFKPFLARDPTGELIELVSGLNAGVQPNEREGVWASRDGERAMLIAQTRALGSDTDGQAAVIGLIRGTFDQIAAQDGMNGLSLQMSGPGLFAVRARATIQEEVARLSLMSTAILAVMLGFVYRRGRLMLLTLVPVLSGTLAAIVTVGVVHGTVFGITVGFGAALIGEAVDYAIYYFVQSGRQGATSWREQYWPTIRLGVMTSVLGFGALLFSGFPGLAQLGLYAISGVLAAALVTRYLLPDLAGPGVHLADGARQGRVLRPLVAHAHVLRWPLLALVLVAGVYLAQHREQLWKSDLSALSTVTQEEGELDAHLRADLGAPDARYMAVITAPDRESALQAAERAGAALRPLVDQGLIGGFDTPARFLPSEAAQAARRASLPTPEELEQRLRQALVDAPLSADRLQPFLDDVKAARNAPPLTRADLDGIGLGLAVDALLLQRPSGWSVLLPLRPPAASENAELPVDAVRAALAGTGALFIDLKGEFDTLYGEYIDEAIVLSLAGFIAITVVLGFVLRSPMRLLGVMLPLVMAVMVVVAGLHMAGVRLHLLHLVGLLLTVAVGSNYTLFFDRLAVGEPLDDETLLSIGVASFTTAVGFGVLAWSSVPVLHAIGITVGPGAVLALILSAAFAVRQRSA